MNEKHSWVGMATNASGAAVAWAGGPADFIAAGTWDGATLTLEISPDNGTTWVAYDATTTVTADARVSIRPGRSQIRPTLSAVGTTDVDVYILPAT